MRISYLRIAHGWHFVNCTLCVCVCVCMRVCHAACVLWCCIWLRNKLYTGWATKPDCF